MRFTIFFRLVVGYIVIFILAIIVSIFVTSQFKKLEDVSSSILNTDNQMLNYNKKLTDALLSQVRYERKFLILNDKALYEHFDEAKNDFDHYYNELFSVADSLQAKNLLESIKKSHQRYQSLFYEEIESLKAGQHHSRDWYLQEKEKAINAIMDDLKELRNYYDNTTLEKIIKLGEAGANARRVAIVITIFFLIFGIVISVFITRSITKPLAVMRKQTRKISKGNYKSDLKLSSPPEIGELAQDFNSMCNKLKALDKMKSDFFSYMSHELRTPLTSIKEGINLLLEGIGGETNEKQNRLLIIMREETNRLIELVNSSLDLSKMEAGMMTYHFSYTPLNHLVNRAITEVEPLAEKKGIKVETEVSKGLPLVRVDSERILQVLRNLLSNAVKFTHAHGNIKISTRKSERGVEISISDTGIGIPKENLDTIFNKFQQAANIHSNPIKGTGLGLASVKHIITAHGGKIWVESKPGHGSTFIFTLQA
jgi:two-component system sensor histidine kinase GlrK